MRSPVRAALLGAVVAALITLPGLGVGTLWDNSETAYGEVAREILLTHDWIVMHLNGSPWFVQPPLYFWFAAMLAKVFGTTALALRLPSAFATIVMGGSIAWAVARCAGTRAGIFASVALSTTLMQAIIGRLAIMDAMLDLFVALGILWFFRALEEGSAPYLVAGFAACALGFLAKGPVAPVIVTLVLLPYAFWNSRNEELRWPPALAWLFGVIVFAAVVLPWPLLLVHRSGGLSVGELIVHYTIGRYTGTIENQSGPIWYYIPVVLLGFFPWTVYLPSAVANGVSTLEGGPYRLMPRRNELVRLAIVWLVIPFLFFSFAKTKLPNYIALELPAAAILVGLFFDNVAERERTRAATFASFFLPVLILLLGVAIGMFSHDNKLGAGLHAMTHHVAIMGAVFFIGSAITMVLFACGREDVAPFALALSVVIAIDVLAIAVIPDTEQFKPVPRLAQTIEQRRRTGDAVAIQNVAGGNALVFYSRPHVYVLRSFNDGSDPDGVDPRPVICNNQRAWILEPSAQRANSPTYGRRRTQVAVDGKAALFLYDGSRC
ncbi:MAG: glycosyltransferase family 39 protein [Candidatus Eremiobacteraeota bacterium]|nr:glycosyltransferase family 39 protein [Candidatus Eremiobacteraeota bacterium]